LPLTQDVGLIDVGHLYDMYAITRKRICTLLEKKKLGVRLIEWKRKLKYLEIAFCGLLAQHQHASLLRAPSCPIRKLIRSASARIGGGFNGGAVRGGRPPRYWPDAS